MWNASAAFLFIGLIMAAPSAGAPITAGADEARFRAIFKEMVETDTSGATGNCTTLVQKVAARMTAAGFPNEDVHILVPPADPRAGNLVAVYRGRTPSAKAVLMLGHIDVVNARREDWTRNPFELIEASGEFFGRGTSDMKAQDAAWVDTMLRLRAAGIRPRRTIKMALTCGEEGGGFVNGAGWLATNHEPLIDAGIAITEGGGGELDQDGRRLAVTVMGAEKSSAAITVEYTGPGGHSSKPRPDNLIVRTASALTRVDQIVFPIQLTPFNSSYFAGLAPRIGGERGAAMERLLADPTDAKAAAILQQNPAWRAMLGTTCIPTLIEGGHAANAQPQRVRATINCRLLPPGDMAALRTTIVEAIADPSAKVDMPVLNTRSRPPSSPLTEAVMGPVRRAAASIFPGIPVIVMQETFATDSARLITVGIPTYGISGMFRGFDSGNIHGLNEHIPVRSVMEGSEFLYQLVRDMSDH